MRFGGSSSTTAAVRGGGATGATSGATSWRSEVRSEVRRSERELLGDDRVLLVDEHRDRPRVALAVVEAAVGVEVVALLVGRPTVVGRSLRRRRRAAAAAMGWR